MSGVTPQEKSALHLVNSDNGDGDIARQLPYMLGVDDADMPSDMVDALLLAPIPGLAPARARMGIDAIPLSDVLPA